MCASFSAQSDIPTLEKFFHFSQHEGIEQDYLDIGTVFPNQRAPIIFVKDGRITLSNMEWSMRIRGNSDPALNKKYSTFNAKSEEIESKRLFQEQWIERRRCIIPVRGFFEYKTERDFKRKMFIGPSERTVMCIAGLWDDTRGLTGIPDKCFTMLTCAPNEQVRFIHDRMPVILRNWKAYLDPRTTPEQAKTLCRPYPGGLFIEAAQGF